MSTFFAYHIEKLFGKFGGAEFFTDKKIKAVKGDECFVVLSIGTNPVVYKLDGKYRIVDLLPNKSGRQPEKVFQIILEPLARPSAPIVLDGDGFDRELFHNKFTSGAGLKEMNDANGSFHKYFDKLLNVDDDLHEMELLNDLNQIEKDDDPTEREESRKARIGQGKFRRNTIDTWDGNEKCAVTGIAIPALLNASHIIPWNEDISQRRSGSNGILLAVHIDRLFDRFLIGFEKTFNPDIYRIVVSPRIRKDFSALAAIGITARTELNLSKVKFCDQVKLESNLRWHLERVIATT